MVPSRWCSFLKGFGAYFSEAILVSFRECLFCVYLKLTLGEVWDLGRLKIKFGPNVLLPTMGSMGFITMKNHHLGECFFSLFSKHPTSKCKTRKGSSPNHNFFFGGGAATLVWVSVQNLVFQHQPGWVIFSSTTGTKNGPFCLKSR